MHPLTVGLAIADKELREEIRACLRSLPARVVLEQSEQVETLQLKRLGPDLLLVEAFPPAEPLDLLIRRFKAVAPGALAVVIHRSPDPELILGAMRAGADEFVIPPLEANLGLALERMAARLARESEPRLTGKVVGFLSSKGGCGATTVACHVASELQRTTSHDILLADLDMEAGMAAVFMKAKTPYSLSDAIQNVHRLDYSLWKALVSRERPRLDVMPAPSPFTVHAPLGPEQFREVFRLVRSIYGWVVVDLGRSLNAVSASLLDGLDELCVVSTPSVMALYQAKLVVQRLLEVGFPRQQLRLILNRVPRRREFTAGEVQKLVGLPVYAELEDRPSWRRLTRMARC